MNEVTNIHLGRETFTISVDAYGTLQTYLHDIKKQLDEDGEAVAEEVELRMAELLGERGVTGKKVILSKDIVYLKQQLGSPQDFKDEDEDEDDTKATDSDAASVPKRLFRDTQSGMVAGVAAGLAEYTGIPVIIIRLIFIGLVFGSGVGLIVYLLLWILIPEAKTPANILQMQGRPVTVNGLKKIAERIDVPGAAQRISGTIHCYGGKIVRFATFVLGIALMLLGIVSFAAVTTAAVYILIHGVRVASILMFPIGSKQVGALVCGFVVVALLAATLNIIGKAIMARKWTLPGWALAAIIGVFITAASAGTALGIDAVPSIQDHLKSIEYSTTEPLTPFSSVVLQGSSVQYEFKYDTSYYMEIHSIGRINTYPIKTTITNGKLTIDTSGLTLLSTDCSRDDSVFNLCPYGFSNVEIIVRGPSAPDMSIDAPDVPMMNVFKPAPSYL